VLDRSSHRNLRAEELAGMCVKLYKFFRFSLSLSRDRYRELRNLTRVSLDIPLSARDTLIDVDLNLIRHCAPSMLNTSLSAFLVNILLLLSVIIGSSPPMPSSLVYLSEIFRFAIFIALRQTRAMFREHQRKTSRRLPRNRKRDVNNAIV